MSVYCIRNSSSLSALDLSPSCHSLTLLLPFPSHNRSEFVQCLRNQGIREGRENTMMEGYRIHSPTHFPPFSPRLEVSEARTSYPFPLHHQCSPMEPGATLDSIFTVQRHSSHRDCQQELGHRDTALGTLRRGRDTIPQGNSKADRGE